MPTSGDTSWTVTALDVVKAAMGPLLDPSEDPDPDESADCLTHLNGLLKSWAMRGVSLSRETTGTVTTVGGSASGSLDASIRAILSARLVVSATQDRPLFPMTRTEYLSLPNKASVGQPTMYYLSRQRDAAVLYLWPVSATAATIAIDYDRLPETVTALTEEIDVRQELFETVWTNLATIIRPNVFGTPCDPLVIARAALLEQQMLDAERPDSYHFETDFDYSYA